MIDLHNDVVIVLKCLHISKMRHCYLFVFVEQRYHNSIIALNAILHEYNTTVPSSMQDQFIKLPP